VKKSILKTPTLDESSQQKVKSRNENVSKTTTLQKGTFEGYNFKNLRNENSYSPKIISRASQNKTTPIKMDHQFSLAKHSNLSVHSGSVRSIS
jgi:hypothetical protein